MTESLQDQIKTFTPFDDLEALQVRQLSQFLADSSNPYDRSNLVAHVVADAWVMNQDLTKVLMMHHAYKGVWITPGGHCDGNPDIAASAMREVAEETGLTNIHLLSPDIFDVNCGYVPYRHKSHAPEPLHLHFDICYLFQGDERAPLTLCEEGQELAWIPVEKLADLTMFEDHKRRVRKTLARWHFPAQNTAA